jgi:putative endonuclease
MSTENNFFVYAIASIGRNYIYVGISDNVIKRFRRHNSGLEKTTAPYKPYVLIFSEGCLNRVEARKREVHYKNSSGKRKLKIIRREIFRLMEAENLLC